MADEGDRGLCHACGGVWLLETRQDGHDDLKCPHCESEFTEIVSGNWPLLFPFPPIPPLIILTAGFSCRLKSPPKALSLNPNPNPNRRDSIHGQIIIRGPQMDQYQAAGWSPGPLAILTVHTGLPMVASPLVAPRSVAGSRRAELPRQERRPHRLWRPLMIFFRV